MGYKRVPVKTAEVYDPPKYSLAVRHGDAIYISGLVGLDRQGNLVGRGDFEAQYRQTIANLGALLRAAGADLDHVLKINTYVTSTDYIPALRQLRREYFPKDPFPAAAMAVVAALGSPDILVQIDAVAATE